MIQANELKVGYYHGYKVDSNGVVYSKVNGKPMKYGISEKGYFQICISILGKKTSKKIHRIVAETFIENPQNKRTVNHKDFNKTNNNLENLEWATHSEQRVHCIENGIGFLKNRDNTGVKNPRAKIKDLDVINIRKIASTGANNNTELAKIYGLNESTINNIIKGRTWKHITH